MKLLEIYIKLKTKNILADCGKLKLEFQWTDDDIQLLLRATQNLKDYKGLNWELTLVLTLTVCS